jgi:hypothetical protein
VKGVDHDDSNNPTHALQREVWLLKLTKNKEKEELRRGENQKLHEFVYRWKKEE